MWILNIKHFKVYNVLSWHSITCIYFIFFKFIYVPIHYILIMRVLCWMTTQYSITFVTKLSTPKQLKEKIFIHNFCLLHNILAFLLIFIAVDTRSVFLRRQNGYSQQITLQIFPEFFFIWLLKLSSITIILWRKIPFILLALKFKYIHVFLYFNLKRALLSRRSI